VLLGGAALVVGIGVLVSGVVGHTVNVPDVVIGVLIFGVGVRLLLRGLPGSGLASRGALRATDRGIVIPGPKERTVPWKKFERLQVSRHGTKVEVFLKLKSGELEAVPTLSRRDLYTRRAHTRATVALQQLETELRDEQKRQLAASGRR
jgi:hypothetical protein